MITGGCPCPVGASLPTIETQLCLEDFGQIQKVAFQRLYKENGDRNSFVTGTPITALASWTALQEADDSTKVVVSPYVNAPTSEAGAPRTFGGGNESLGGIEEIIGREPTPFTAVLRRLPQATIKLLKQLQCEEIGVYYFSEHGLIEAHKGEVEGTHYPIPLRSFFIGDKTHGGLEAPDSNAIQWMHMPNWSDDLVVVKPAFNPLTALNIG